MKTINILLLFILSLFFQVSLGQTIVTKEISGRVTADSSSVEAITIVNNTTQETTISDNKGQFSIVVKDGDVLVFSAVNLEPLRKRITANDLKLDLLLIKMTARNIELKEVVINEYSNINAENLGIIPYGQKKYTPAERKLYTAKSSITETLLNKISGRTAMLKKEAVVEKKEILYSKIEYLFEENYYTERLKIPLEHIKGFQLYCIDDPEFVNSLNAKNKTVCMFLITGLAQKYLTIISNEK
ncbi:carboxypeptidase-like regulatory domain-containing protein [Flavobacterium sp. LS1R47]|uniref:Carboxypeptidase-like regulatory domain-containing protein n=1 Tax=Flavobacterium frigoritolerans TaxID=2987686 RepID=A0A9X2YZP1_9FLAO|nr:carboxypeptidase-like regulatory domain-containing protein [Flavobacterium frigoritolerans]MCV9932628.1 carboxypeptidase-like regulatory domain-containing protein [Flavobacterium frigoritolerans]